MEVSATSGLLKIAFGVGFYFLPTFILWFKDHRHGNAIVIVNLFLGWTLVGWVWALAWALMDQPSRSQEPKENPEEKRFPLIDPLPDKKVCPRCAEDVKRAALICRFCGHEFAEAKQGE